MTNIATTTFAQIAALLMLVFAAAGPMTAYGATAHGNHFGGGGHFRGGGLSLGILGANIVSSDPCANILGTVAVQTTTGVTCVTVANAQADIQGLNEGVIISGFHHHR